jgi:hypothetical protein
MKTEGERLRYYIESKEVSVRNFCVKNEIGYSGFHQVLQGSRNLGVIVLKQVMDAYPNLNVNWVLTGRGSVEINPEEADALSEPQPIYGKIDPGFDAFLKYFDKETTVNKINALIDKRLKNED